MSLPDGARVCHPRFGLGAVLRSVGGGQRALVRWDDGGPPRVVPVDHLERAALSPEPAPSPEPARPRDGGLPPLQARQALEALRLGVVPAHGLGALTVGRDRELTRLHRLLDGDGTGLLTIEGHYGAGKSHLIALAGAAAEERGWVVARASFDPLEVPPSHPLRIYRALAGSLQVPGATTLGLGPLLDQAAEHRALAPHRFLEAGRFARAEPGVDAILQDDVMDLIHGRAAGSAGDLDRRLRRAGYDGDRLLGLPDYRTFGQILAHLLAGIGRWSQAVGHRGLLVLLDEAEYLDRIGSTARSLAQNVLRHLALASLPDEALAFAPASVPRGGHAVHRGLAPRLGEGPSVAVVAAFTPDPSVHAALAEVLRDPSAHAVPLRPVRGAELPALGDRVLQLVIQAHPELAPPPADRHGAARLLGRAFASGAVGSARQAARLVVAFWDLYRVDPARARAAAD